MGSNVYGSAPLAGGKGGGVSTLPDEMSTDTADKAIWQREGLLWRLCFTKLNRKDTAPNETASAARASAMKRNKLRGKDGFIYLLK